MTGAFCPCLFLIVCAIVNRTHRKGDNSMAFFDFLFREQKNIDQLIEDDSTFELLREITIEYRGKRIVYEINQGLITYKNIISPRDGGRHFPKGYFDVKTVALPENARKEIHKLIDTVTSQLPFVDTLALLPDGASHDALLICTKNTGNQIFYTNRHLSETGFSVRTEPISAPFLELFNVLSAFCKFVPEVDVFSVNSHVDKYDLQDDRYFNETLWLCDKCFAGNLMEQRSCIKCGTPRPW